MLMDTPIYICNATLADLWVYKHNKESQYLKFTNKMSNHEFEAVKECYQHSISS